MAIQFFLNLPIETSEKIEKNKWPSKSMVGILPEIDKVLLTKISLKIYSSLVYTNRKD